MKGKLFSNFKGDVFGGITAGIVALPLALAFGVQSGLGASAGIYGAIFLGIFASVFGGTPAQISGPTGPMTIISASVVSLVVLKTGSIETGIGIIIATFFLAGLFQVLFGILKIGKYIKYIPYPVISGFMSGIGFIIIFLQLFPFFGHVSPAKITSVFVKFHEVINNINYHSLFLGGLTVLIIYLFPKISKKIPGTLVALLVCTLISVFMDFEVPVIGNIPSGFPSFRFQEVFNVDFLTMTTVLVPAITLAGLGTIDSLLTSVVADNITKTKHDSNKELIGQGIGNMVSSIFGGIPGAGATMRTLVNVKSGGGTRLSGIIHGILLLLIMLGIGKYVSHIPLSVLAGILITVGISIIDRKGLKDIFAIPKADAAIMLIVLGFTVFVDLLQAVGIGMVMASVLFMKKASDLVDSGTHVSEIQKTDRELPWEDEYEINQDLLKKIYIARLDGPVFFGAVSKLQQSISNIPHDVEIVIIRMKKVPYLDQSGLYALESAVMDLQSKNISVKMTMVQRQPMYMMKKINMIPDILDEKSLFDSFEKCAEWLKVNQNL
jgi:SulP family sulfate permease